MVIQPIPERPTTGFLTPDLRDDWSNLDSKLSRPLPNGYGQG